MKWVRELTLAPGGRSSMGCPSYSFPRPPGYAIGADGSVVPWYTAG